MTATLSRALLSLAMCSLGESRREWALAMQAEFDEAIADGKPFAFATGCLVAAWREMPKHMEGRLVLANYALALGLLIPMAVFQFALVFGFSSVFAGGEVIGGVPLASTTPIPGLSLLERGGAPCLLALWLVLGIGHLCLAWVLVDRDWVRVVRVSAFIGATLATLFILAMGASLEDISLVILQAPAMAIELTALVAVARRHARLLPGDALEMPAR